MRDHSFEDRLNELLRDGRIGLGKPSNDAMHALEASLAAIPDLLVQKRRAQPARKSMVEVSCNWFGMDADTGTIGPLVDRAVAEALPTAQRTLSVEPDVVRVRFLLEKNGVYVTGAAIVTL